MTNSTFAQRVTQFFVIFAMLAGCGSPELTPARGSFSLSADMSQPLGVPQHKALLYAMAPSVMGYMLTYPQGKQVGFTNGNAFQYGLCANSRGEVFLSGYIPSGDIGILARYLHGSHKPGKTLFAHSVSFESCSFDPLSGHIAATAFFTQRNIWKVAIFQNINSSPVYYEVPSLKTLAFCGYDNNGNLVVDGGTSSGAELAELPAGGKQFVDVTLNKSLASPGNVQWADGSLTIEDLSAAVIDRVTISGSTGTITGETILHGAQNHVFQSFIQGSTVIAAFGTQGEEIGFWKYPQGGEPTKTLSDFGQVTGIAVSVAPK